MKNRLRFLLQSPIKAPDSLGGFEEFWQDEGWYWGKILSQNPAKHANFEDSRYFLAVKIHLFDIKGSGLRASWRLCLADEIYEILGFESQTPNTAFIFAQKEGFDVL